MKRRNIKWNEKNIATFPSQMNGFGSLEPRWLISCAVIKRMPFKLKVFVLFSEKIAIFIFGRSFIPYPYAYMQIEALKTIGSEVKKKTEQQNKTVKNTNNRRKCVPSNQKCDVCTAHTFALCCAYWHISLKTMDEDRERGGEEQSEWEREKNEWEQRQQPTKKMYIHHTQTHKHTKRPML